MLHQFRKLLLSFSVVGFCLQSSLAAADWTLLPSGKNALYSLTFWKMVNEDRASVLSTTSAQRKDGNIEKQIVFKILDPNSTDVGIEWAKRKGGDYSPVLCIEVSDYGKFRKASSCFVPGLLPEHIEAGHTI